MKQAYATGDDEGGDAAFEEYYGDRPDALLEELDFDDPSGDWELMFRVKAGDDSPARFAEEIDQWNRDGRPDGELFILGSTGDVLQGLGAMEKDIFVRSEKINFIVEDHPEMSLAFIKRIPEILEDPVMILKSRNVKRGNSANTRMILYGGIRASNGLPVLVVLDLRPVENGIVVEDMQKVSSAYTKTTDAKNFVRRSEILYADKKRTTSLLRTIGFRMPIELQQSGYTGNISYRGQNVNIQGERFENVIKESTDGGTGKQYSVKEDENGFTEGWYQDDEAARAARLEGYPVLNGVQVVPMKTWVRAQDYKRNDDGSIFYDKQGNPVQYDNYGLVAGLGDRPGTLKVNFRNKNVVSEETGQTIRRDGVQIAYGDLTPVPGVFQQTDEDFRSLIAQAPEEPGSHDYSEAELAEIEKLLDRAGMEEDGNEERPVWEPVEPEMLGGGSAVIGRIAYSCSAAAGLTGARRCPGPAMGMTRLRERLLVRFRSFSRVLLFL